MNANDLMDDTFDYSQLGMSAEDYEFGQHLGDGGFGRVYQAVDRRTGREVAIKVLDKRKVHQRNMSSRVISEISIHQRLKHPFVLQLYSYFEDATNVYLVLELCHRGNLHDYVKQNGRLGPDKVRYFLKQIITGLKYLHQNRIMHRDLTLANLLLTKDNRVKISDFGLATEVSEDRTNKTMCGTPNYISPEVSSQGVQGLAVDVWSLGVMLYTMLVGKAPFDTKDPKSTIDNARKLRYEIPGSLGAEAIDLISKLLRELPQDRLPLSEILDHPFMRKAAHERSGSNDSGNDSLQSSCPLPDRRQRCHSGNSRHSDSQGYVSAAHSDSSPLQQQRQQQQQQLLQQQQSCASNPQPRRRRPSPTPPTLPTSTPTLPTSTPTAPPADVDSDAEATSRLPLDTRRLEACRLAKGSSVLTVADDGWLTVEQLRRRRGQQRVAKLLRVSPDGRRVQFLPSVGCGDGLPLLDDRPVDFDDSEAESFEYPELSEQCSRMYQFAASFVNILRSNTPKVTLYTETAKCVLYENCPDPDFGVYFYCGRRARTSARCPISIDGCPVQVHSMSPEEADILQFVTETRQRVASLEAALSAASGSSPDAFPAIVGRPPAAATPPTSGCETLAVDEVSQPTEASALVTFSDGSRLRLLQEAGCLRRLLFADAAGREEALDAGDRLPAGVQLRLRLLLECPAAPDVTLPLA